MFDDTNMMIAYGFWVYSAIHKRQGDDIDDHQAGNARFIDTSKHVIDAILVAMRSKADLGLVQLWACLALYSICDYDAQRAHARCGGAIELVQAAEAAFPKLEDMDFRAEAVLCILQE